MTAPPRSKTTAGKRFYTWRNENYWSVTTLINGGLPKPVLVNWAKLFTAKYAVEHFDAFSVLVKDDPEGAVEWLKGAAFRDRDRKADLGTSVHVATESYILGKPQPEWPLPIRPRMAGFVGFLDEFEPEFEGTEMSVYSRSQRYAGTLDAIATIRGRKLLIDYKTGKGVYPEVALQLAAYRHAEFIGAPDGSEKPMPAVDGCAVLHLPDDGGYEFVDVVADDEVFKFFLYVREVFRWLDGLSKQVIVGPWPTTLPAEQLTVEEVA